MPLFRRRAQHKQARDSAQPAASEAGGAGVGGNMATPARTHYPAVPAPAAKARPEHAAPAGSPAGEEPASAAQQAAQLRQLRHEVAPPQEQQEQQKQQEQARTANSPEVAAAKAQCVEDGLFLDEQALLKQSSFPIPPGQLIELAKDVLRAGVHKCGKLAPDFSFSAPFIGPLSAEDFGRTMETLSLDDVFPDLAPRICQLRVDALEPNRVYFTTRPVGTHTSFLKANLLVPVPPSGKVVELPPQTSSLSFNEHGEVVGFTMGYVMDRRIGNSGGLGGAFGLLWGIGVPLPYPEGKPWSSSWQQRLFNTGNPLLQCWVWLLDRTTSWLLPGWLTASHARNMP